MTKAYPTYIAPLPKTDEVQGLNQTYPIFDQVLIQFLIFSHDHGVFSLGVIILVLSLASVWWLQRRAHIIFGEGAACQENSPVDM